MFNVSLILFCFISGGAEIYPSGDPGGMDDGHGGDPIEPQPEEIDEASVDLTPFGILFDIDDSLGTPSSDDYAMAIEVTVGYLNTFMSLQYEGAGLEEFITTPTTTIFRDGVPQIDFTASATFRGIEVEAPSTEQMDDKVAQAFSGANLALYLSMLQNLPAENAFSTTTGARLTNPVGATGSRSSLIGSVSTVGKAGIAGAIGAGGLIILAIGFMIYGKHGRTLRAHGSAEITQTKNSNEERRKLRIPEQEAVISETTTCASSTDGSGTSNTTADSGRRISLSINHRKSRNIAEEEKKEEEHGFG